MNQKIRKKIISLLHLYGQKIPDYPYLKLYTSIKTGESYNLKKPKSYNEKINWLKMNYRNSLLTICADKYAVRDYVSNKIGNEYLIPLLWSGKDANEIPFKDLPNSFVLKTNNASGTNIIIENKNEMDEFSVKTKLNEWLLRDYFYPKREWAYKEIEPRIVCEKFLKQDDYDELRDYRFFCFNGEPKFISVDFSINNKSKTRRNLYDLDWKLMNEEISYPKELDISLNKPEKLEEMIELSKKLSQDLPHVRVDFYYIQNQIYFGEMTFYHQSGMGKIEDDFNKKMGSWMELPKT